MIAVEESVLELLRDRQRTTTTVTKGSVQDVSVHIITNGDSETER